jgi:hypothetical protein
MAIAGWCASCGAYVYCGEDGSCVNGHPAAAVTNHYDPDTGVPVAPPAAPAPVAEAPVAAPAAPVAEVPAPAVVAPAATASGTRDAVLMAVMAAFAAYPGYVVAYGPGTDIVIGNQVADASWGTGKKKVEYSAALKAVEPERTLYFWEMLKEKGAGLSFGTFESESYSTFGTKRSGTTKEVVIGPGGAAVDYSWDYGKTRAIVEAAAAQHGWRVKVVLNKAKAMW